MVPRLAGARKLMDVRDPGLLLKCKHIVLKHMVVRVQEEIDGERQAA